MKKMPRGKHCKQIKRACFILVLLLLVDAACIGPNIRLIPAREQDVGSIDETFMVEILAFDPPYAGDRKLAMALKTLSVMEEEDPKAYHFLKVISGTVGTSFPEALIQWHKIHRIREERTGEPDPLTRVMDNHWASREQFMSGKILAYWFGLDPWAGVLLNETGGSIGPGGGWMSLVIQVPLHHMDTVNSHAAFHDAYGYLYNCHGALGPGYLYAGSKGLVYPGSPMAGHFTGMAEQMKHQKDILPMDFAMLVGFLATPWYVHAGKIMLVGIRNMDLFGSIKEMFRYLPGEKDTSRP
ncbi:MAG: hypothetical protein R6W96_07525 [Clostridia bacterium]